MPVALETAGLSKAFGGVIATNGLSLRLAVGARHALIGPNGAGKTTFVNLLTGVLAPTAGRIFLHGEEITGMAPWRRVRRGLARTFQITQLFADMTPRETIGLAVAERQGVGADPWRSVGRRDIAVEVAAIVSRFGLADVVGEPASKLPYGKRRLLEIAIAFACRPRVLLLDEPAAGVPEAERQQLLATLAALPRDVTVLLIEHDMDLVFSFADRISVLVNGGLCAEGSADEIASDPRVRDVYLGASTDA
jgi:ABC-type branched-subunit amino acid transport system ATPase component